MAKSIGIARSLYYYELFPFWQVFWQDLGFEVVVSPPTSRKIIDQGVIHAVDGTCLPVKSYYGHVCALAEQGVDFLFVPRLISVAPREYICPKFMGLPDMVRASLPDLPPIISPEIDARRGRHHLAVAYLRLAKTFTSWTKALSVYRRAVKVQQDFEHRLTAGRTVLEELENQCFSAERGQRLSIALLGHSYLVNDLGLTMGLLKRLREQKVDVVVPENLPRSAIEEQARSLPKRMFWTSGKQMLGAIRHLRDQVDGFISVTAFACGTDSLTGELVEGYAQEHAIPHLLLNLDEHTGEAGVVTRLEAFLDMLERRKLYAADHPAHG